MGSRRRRLRPRPTPAFGYAARRLCLLRHGHGRLYQRAPRRATEDGLPIALARDPFVLRHRPRVPPLHEPSGGRRGPRRFRYRPCAPEFPEALADRYSEDRPAVRPATAPAPRGRRHRISNRHARSWSGPHGDRRGHRDLPGGRELPREACCDEAQGHYLGKPSFPKWPGAHCLKLVAARVDQGAEVARGALRHARLPKAKHPAPSPAKRSLP